MYIISPLRSDVCGATCSTCTPCRWLISFSIFLSFPKRNCRQLTLPTGTYEMNLRYKGSTHVYTCTCRFLYYSTDSAHSWLRRGACAYKRLSSRYIAQLMWPSRTIQCRRRRYEVTENLWILELQLELCSDVLCSDCGRLNQCLMRLCQSLSFN